MRSLGFSVPFGLLLWMVAFTALADTTTTLRPTGDGSQDSANWSTKGGSACNGTDCFVEVDETAGSECGGSDGDTTYIQSNTQNASQTVTIPLTDISNNATITEIDVTACHVKGESGQANKFQIRYCIDDVCTNSGHDVTPATTYHEASESFSGLNITKSDSTDLEIGIMVTHTANKIVRISQLSAIVTYTSSATPAPSPTPTPTPSSPGNSGNNNSNKKSGGDAPLYHPDGVDEAPLHLDQGTVEPVTTGSAERTVSAAPGQILTISTRPIDSDRVKTVRLRIGGTTHRLQDKDGDGVYTVLLHLPNITGSVPYSLTADYSITSRTEHGSFVLGTHLSANTVDRQPNAAHSFVLIPFINYLYRMVFEHNPSLATWHYWAQRLNAGHKQTLPELYGAMQWQLYFGSR